MGRPLTEFVPPEDDSAGVRQARLDRSTARVLGAAVAVLATATVVVGQSTSALRTSGTATANEFSSGRISLEDDDQGRSLVSLENMAPGRPVSRCLSITYTGSVLPVQLSMAAEISGDVAPFVDVEVAHGISGGFDSCAGFEATGVVFSGTLADLDRRGSLDVGRFRSEGEERSFRFTFDLIDVAEAADRSGSVDFVWEAVPE